MKKITRISPFLLAIFSILLIAGYGCKDDFFDVTAGDRITPDQHYQTLIDANVSLQGAFVTLQDVMPKLIMYDGLRSDAMDVTPNASSYLRELNYQILSKGNPLTDPSDLYKVIINVNEVLANIDLIEERDRNFDELTAWQYKGALIGLRSWSYLTLARLYNKVVYIDGNMVTLPAPNSQKVLSKRVILDTLINQITPYILDNSKGTQYEELRIQRFMNTKALLGEIYLEAGDYANAAKYLKLACESYLNQPAMLKVDKTYKDAAWGAIFLNAESNTVENISVVPFSRAEGQNNPLASWLINEYVVKPSVVLIDSFKAQIPLAGTPGDLYRWPITMKAMGVTYNEDSTDYELVNPIITKYALDAADMESSDIIISRAADIQLMLAEAYNRLGDATSRKYALMLLNQGVNKENPKPAPFSKWSGNLGVRGRVYLKSREVPKNMISQDSIQDLIEDFIMEERAMELAFEGKRWFDLVRVAERRDSPEYIANKVAAKFEGTDMYNTVHAKLMNRENWYLPME